MQTFVTEAVDRPDNAAALRDQVRALVAEHGESDPVRRANSWTKPDPAFSRLLGDAGLLGMTWPKEYGGHERSQLERYVVIEELLAMGASGGAPDCRPAERSAAVAARQRGTQAPLGARDRA